MVMRIIRIFTKETIINYRKIIYSFIDKYNYSTIIRCVRTIFRRCIIREEVLLNRLFFRVFRKLNAFGFTNRRIIYIE